MLSRRRRFLKSRWNQPPDTETRGSSSCWTLTLVSMLYIRLMSGSNFERLATPKPAGSCARLISQPARQIGAAKLALRHPVAVQVVQVTFAVVSASGL